MTTTPATQMTQRAREAVGKSAALAVTGKHRSALSVVKTLCEKDDVKKRFQDILGKKANQFLASITSLVSSSTNFNDVDPNTIMSGAIVAATLDLPINPNLGFAYIIPYNSPDGKKAQFQMGYKGFLQLALRSGQFKTINATEVYEGELVGLNRLTGEISLDESKKKTQKVVGYAAYFRLVNGFEKTLYMSVEDIQRHGKRFSKSYDKENGLWKKDFHSMAMKTVIKLLLSKYGILSVDMQRAVEVDQGVIKEDSTVEYVDAVDTSDDGTSAESGDQPHGISADPDTEIIAKSAESKKGYLALLKKATPRNIRKLENDINNALNAGELTQDDYNAIETELNAHRQGLEG